MSNVQMIIYDGWLVDKPELRFTPTGSAVANFRMGSSQIYRDKNGEQKKVTTWLKVAVWGANAERIAKHCQKGTRVQVHGRLRPNPETGSPEIFTLKTGEAAASYEINARDVFIISGGVFENRNEEEDDNGGLPY